MIFIMAVIISADDIKKKLSNYSPEKAEQYHRESADAWSFPT